MRSLACFVGAAMDFHIPPGRVESNTPFGDGTVTATRKRSSGQLKALN
jgi:hypothetical protein